MYEKLVTGRIRYHYFSAISHYHFARCIAECTTHCVDMSLNNVSGEIKVK